MQKKPNILIVDDDVVHTVAFSSRLQRRGFDTHHIPDGKTLIELLSKNQFNLVLLDIDMPGLNGFELLKLVRKTYPAGVLPVIMLTSSNSSQNIQEAFLCGANDYIHKPVNLDAAVARIYGQLSAVELSRLHLESEKINTMNAMITTYHHEINNPLAIAIATLDALIQAQPNAIPEESIQRMRRAFSRILEILAAMKNNQQTVVRFDKYSADSKMINFKKGSLK